MVRVRFSVLEVCTFLLASLVVLVLGERQVNQSCFLTTGKPGRCIHLKDCTEVVELMKRNVVYKQEMEQINAWIGACEGDKNSVNTMVCCESPTSVPSERRMVVTTTTTTTTAASIPITTRPTRPRTTTTVSTTTVKTRAAIKPDHFKDVLPQFCGRRNEIAYQIISNVTDDNNDHPWVVYLEIQKPNLKAPGRCVGTLIQESYVLTAAHCLHTLSKEYIKLFFGAVHISKLKLCVDVGECEERNASELILHRDYNSHTKWNDIALVRLNEPVDTSDNIAPACLPLNYTFDESFPNDERVLSLGWGANEQGTMSDSKGVAYLKVISKDDCGDFLKKSSRLNATTMFSVMCTIGVIPGQDVCQGDSGAPMLHLREKQFFVVGVVSFGPKCGLENVPGVSVRVSEYIEWILINLKRSKWLTKK